MDGAEIGAECIVTAMIFVRANQKIPPRAGRPRRPHARHRVTEGSFHAAETAVIVPRGNSEALEAASELMRRLKRDGTVAASFRRHGMEDAVISAGGVSRRPPATRH